MENHADAIFLPWNPPIFCMFSLFAFFVCHHCKVPPFTGGLVAYFLGTDHLVYKKINPMATYSKIEIANSYDNCGSAISYSNGKVVLNWWPAAVFNVFHGLRQGNRSLGDVIVSSRRKSSNDSLFPSTQAAYSSSDLIHGDEKLDHRGEKNSGPLVSGIAYCLSSCSMILLNKVALSTYNFNAGISLMFYQNLISTVIVILLGLFGAVSVEKLNWKLIKIWIPVNLIFVGMLVSGMYSLKYINIAMVTILKNITNILTAIGELYIFKKHQNQKIISAVSSGITDLTFDSTGYTWQVLNCILTASYSLTLRSVMNKAKQSTMSGSLNEVSMVLLNNALSLPFALVLILVFGEWDYIKNTDVILLPMFWVVATFSGLLGLAISFTSVVFKPNKPYYLQPCRLFEQDTNIHNWHTHIQRST